MRLRSEDKHHLRKSADRDRKAQISPVSGTNAFLICAFRPPDFLRWCLSSERSLTLPVTHNLFFLFPIENKDGTAGNSIVCFGAPIPCHAAIWHRQNDECEFYEELELFRRVQRSWQRNVWTQWSDRDTNDIFAHCSLIFYYLDFKFSNFVCPSELHPLIWFFLKNSFTKKKNIRKTFQNALAPSIFIVWSIVLKLGTPLLHIQAQNMLLQNFNFALEVEICTKNLQKRCFTPPGRLWRSITFIVGRN